MKAPLPVTATGGAAVLDLASLAWTVRQAGTRDPVPARVPGCVHLDLLAAGRIPDPFDRDHELALMHIGRTDWIYETSFDAGPEFPGADSVRLEFDGLDTLADITLNGRRLGRTDNMFRAWSFPVARLLKPEGNRLAVRFRAAAPAAERLQRKGRRLYDGSRSYRLPGANRLRKQQSNFGWDWGVRCVTCGIWRPARLRADSLARLGDVRLEPRVRGDRGEVGVRIGVERFRRGPLRLRATLRKDGKILARAEVPVRAGGARLALRLRRPRLWWPNGLGDQPLYDTVIELVGPGGPLETAVRRIGFRTLELRRRRDRWGESFAFVCNGTPFFAKGANWIPADAFPARLTRGDYGRLLSDAASAHMNMLRVWGGGIYEDNAFYELCDEKGILVWQDFMFACAAYPAFDPDFLENVRREAEETVRRLRHHACLALWCGNNELEMMKMHRGPELGADRMTLDEYRALFDSLLPRVVRRLDPGRPYWPSSSHTPGKRDDTENPRAGDAHLWQVFNRRAPVEAYRESTHRFCSEFGFQSFPEPRTVAAYTRAADRNIVSPVMEHHQRHPVGNSNILHYMLDWFRMPSTFENTLWVSQIIQAEAIRCAVEHFRRIRPRCMGALYWQLNDCWPVASWSSIDWFGRWKALHFAARRFFAPVLLSAVEDAARGTLDVHLSNDRTGPARGLVRWRATTARGDDVAGGKFEARAPGLSSRRVARLDLRDALAGSGPRNLLVWLRFEDALGRDVSAATALFCRPKHLDLPDPGFSTTVRPLPDDAFEVTLRARRPALWAWLRLKHRDARFDENFVCLEPGRALRIRVRPDAPVSQRAFARDLVVSSLRDTFK